VSRRCSCGYRHILGRTPSLTPPGHVGARPRRVPPVPPRGLRPATLSRVSTSCDYPRPGREVLSTPDAVTRRQCDGGLEADRLDRARGAERRRVAPVLDVFAEVQVAVDARRGLVSAVQGAGEGRWLTWGRCRSAVTGTCRTEPGGATRMAGSTRTVSGSKRMHCATSSPKRPANWQGRTSYRARSP
jgi:hypothetical protein